MHFVAKEDKSVSPLRNEALGISFFVRVLVTVIPELFIAQSKAKKDHKGWTLAGEHKSKTKHLFNSGIMLLLTMNT